MRGANIPRRYTPLGRTSSDGHAARGGSLHRRGDAGHDPEHVAVGIVEEGHPFFGARGLITMDHVWRALEVDVAGGGRRVGRMDVRHGEVEDRARLPIFV